MDAVLAGVFGLPLDLGGQRRVFEGGAQGDAAEFFETSEQLRRAAVQQRALAVLGGLEFVAVAWGYTAAERFAGLPGVRLCATPGELPALVFRP